VDDIRVGRIARALRRRARLTQRELGRRCGLSQQAISLLERGHGSHLSGATMRRVFAALDARWEPTVTWRGGEVDRLLDAAHARLVAVTVDFLHRRGWEIEIEPTYSNFGERGSIDILAWRPGGFVVIVVEVKSALMSVEGTLRKLDEKVRNVRDTIAVDRFGRGGRVVARLLVLPSTTVARRRVELEAGILGVALPDRGATVRDWLRAPADDLRGIWFAPDTNGRSERRE
jgi:transcriptional regulator with XRE-family HTH domain